MTIFDVDIDSLAGGSAEMDRFRGQVVLVVNVASRCGLTPQYAGLQALYDTYAGHGFTVLGVPCNQFAGQEPGNAEEIQTFCSTTYGVTFPLFEKIDVNGENRHPIYAELTRTDYDDEPGGDIKWNFEKFLVVDGKVVHRWSPMVTPDAPEVVEAIEGALGGS